MINRTPVLITAVTAAILLGGCGGGSSDSNITPPEKTDGTVHRLTPQAGTDGYLFYGNTDHKSLDRVVNVKVIDPTNPQTPVVENDDTDVGYAVVTTAVEGYDAATNTYTNLHKVSVAYVAGDSPWTVPMAKDAAARQRGNSAAGRISPAGRRGYSYQKINYLGSRQYLTARDANGSQILITPEMGPDDAPLPFENKTLLTLAYSSYGAPVDGYIVYDANASALQKCDLAMACTDLASATGAPKYLGDLGGTTLGVLVMDNTGYTLDKADGNLSKLAGLVLPPKVGHSTPYQLMGGSIFMFENGNISRYDIATQQTTSVTRDGKAEKFHGFTNDWVFFGSDGLIEAARKDGSTPEPIVLSETTATKGHKYITNYGVGDQYLYVTYRLDESGLTHFKACIFEDENRRTCLDNSFWAAIVPAKNGSLNFDSSYPYTPYAFVRVDDTDYFGGGKLKAIDPAYAAEDGITMGEIANYNFQRFMQTSRYYDEIIDSNGSIVLYAKDDTTITENAFMMNLLKENSLVNLSNEAPAGNLVNEGRDHCHGRYCMLCHSFAAGKIYQDRNGTKSAYGYNIRFVLENGTEKTARVGKGKGENFNIDPRNLGMPFTPVIIDADTNATTGSFPNTEVHRADQLNCDFCHGRSGNFKDGAVSAIAVDRTN